MDARKKWRRHVRRWSKSGLTCAEYSAQEGINTRALSYWKWRFGKEEEAESIERVEPPFVEVTSAATWSQKADRIEIVIAADLFVRVPEQFVDGPQIPLRIG